MRRLMVTLVVVLVAVAGPSVSFSEQKSLLYDKYNQPLDRLMNEMGTYVQFFTQLLQDHSATKDDLEFMYSNGLAVCFIQTSVSKLKTLITQCAAAGISSTLQSKLVKDQADFCVNELSFAIAFIRNDKGVLPEGVLTDQVKQWRGNVLRAYTEYLDVCRQLQ